MPYAPPTFGPAGLSISSYTDILQDNIAGTLNIFGQTMYIGVDSAIYQLIAILSLKQSDTQQALQLLVNQLSPTTAVGAGLDRTGKFCGTARNSYSYSTALLTLVGEAGAVIANGTAEDQNGYEWVLPPSVTIPPGGVITVNATCLTPGNISAAVGQINIIAVPQAGWVSVTNGSAAIPGDAVESDSRYRARQAISVAIPSQTRLQATVAALAQLAGVTRVAQGTPTPNGPGSSIENPTGAPDSWGNPAHSISMVVEGGADADVALAIYKNRGVGPLTNGSSSAVVTDPNTGYEMTISWYRPTYVPVYVEIVLKGYQGVPTSATVNAVQAAIVNYLNSLSIGETVSIAAINYAAMAVNSNLSVPGFGVQTLAIGTAPAPSGTTDIAMPTFYSVSQGALANVVVTAS